ncbi:uncharacterized protein LOC109425366 [Aedes albopictus]|uniref:THAP-type domain-containing protein n=1 Tax=Aedes albopictus TaxID=7160 RepID=A0ABM2A2R4_AEDAL
MNPELIDPLGPKSAGIRYCSACDNNSATYAGKFLASPHNPDARRQWMVRIGVIKATDPFPGMKRVYVCDNHFDKQNDFITDRRYGPRLRQGTLPWRNLKTGIYSYHGLELETPPPCQCDCCTRKNSASAGHDRRLVMVQTDDVESKMAQNPTRVTLYASQCRLCLQKLSDTDGSLMRLFCPETRQSICPDLMEQIYVTVGLLLNYGRDADASICYSCRRQIDQAYRFRLQTRTNNDAFLATDGLVQRSRKLEKAQLRQSAANIEQVLVENLEEDAPSMLKPEEDMETVKLVPQGEIDYLVQHDVKEEPMEEPEYLEEWIITDVNVKQE